MYNLPGCWHDQLSCKSWQNKTPKTNSCFWFWLHQTKTTKWNINFLDAKLFLVITHKHKNCPKHKSKCKDYSNTHSLPLETKYIDLLPCDWLSMLQVYLKNDQYLVLVSVPVMPKVGTRSFDVTPQVTAAVYVHNTSSF